MSTTGFSAVQAALLAALVASPALAGGNVSANPTRAIPAAQSTAIALRLDRSTGAEGVIGTIDWATDFVVECYGRGTNQVDPVAAVDALLHSAWGRLAGLTSAQLGGDITMQPAVDWQFDAGETPVVAAVIRVTVAHRTTTASLTAS